MAAGRVRGLRRALRVVDPTKTEDVQDVVLDLETTGAQSHIHEIIQVAAMTTDQLSFFNVYVMPLTKIPPFIVGLTGIDIVTIGGNPCMRADKQPVESFTLQEAMEKFVDFLKLNKKGEVGKINLMAHNGVNFDCRFLHRALSRTNLLSEFEEVVASVTDTLHAFKDAMPSRSHKQPDLVADFLPEREYRAHNALDDVKALNALLPKVGHISYIQNCTYTLESVIAAIQV